MVVDSATSQFFINLVDNAFLNHRDKSPQGYGYCVFGQVTEGMDVVDKIAAVKRPARTAPSRTCRPSGGHQEHPHGPVTAAGGAGGRVHFLCTAIGRGIRSIWTGIRQCLPPEAVGEWQRCW